MKGGGFIAGKPTPVWGIMAGLLWGLFLTMLPDWLGLRYLPPQLSLPGAMVGPGVVLLMMIAWSGARDLRDGQDATDRRALARTLEPAVLALLLWPFIAMLKGGATVLILGGGFALTQTLFWIGCHRSAVLASFGWWAGFLPTLVAFFWALTLWLT